MIMASLIELRNDVATLLNRPDLVDTKIAVAVNEAVLSLHQKDYFLKDLYEYTIRFDNSTYYQQLQVTQLISKYRKLSYVRIWDNISQSAGKKLKIIGIDKVIDSYGVELTDTVYEAGVVINIKTLEPFQFILLGVYEYPDIVEASFNSWIAREHPFAIVYKACMIVAKSIGLDEESKGYGNLYNDQLSGLMATGLATKGM